MTDSSSRLGLSLMPLRPSLPLKPLIEGYNPVRVIAGLLFFAASNMGYIAYGEATSKAAIATSYRIVSNKRAARTAITSRTPDNRSVHVLKTFFWSPQIVRIDTAPAFTVLPHVTTLILILLATTHRRAIQRYIIVTVLNPI